MKTDCLAKSTDIVAKDVPVSPDLFAEVVSPDSAYAKSDRHGPSVKIGEDERFRRLLKYTSAKGLLEASDANGPSLRCLTLSERNELCVGFRHYGYRNVRPAKLPKRSAAE